MAKSKGHQLARRRGREFEHRVARKLGGRRWEGEDGDVEARGYRVECKFRSGKKLEDIPNVELASWFQQIRRYQAKNPETEFLLAYSGGRDAGNEIWIAMPLQHFDELTHAVEDREKLAFFRTKYPQITDRLEALLFELLSMTSHETEQQRSNMLSSSRSGSRRSSSSRRSSRSRRRRSSKK